ncbi:MAG: hypothetical protein Q7K57_54660 [Burkholderiaceae bacterium]|nr:hypothetical protein [Burkholderiaceae bacterium]
MSDPLQHYVPKFMLRRFSSGKKDLVHAYDKAAGFDSYSAVTQAADVTTPAC